MDTNPPSSTIATRHPYTSCQRRKVKCDRLSPVCTGCLTHGQECRQPAAAAQRAPRRPRRVNEYSVSQRVNQLEKSLEEMKMAVLARDVKLGAADAPATQVGSAKHGYTGRLIVEDEKSRYVSGSSWANLADVVCCRGRNMLDFTNQPHSYVTLRFYSKMTSRMGKRPPTVTNCSPALYSYLRLPIVVYHLPTPTILGSCGTSTFEFLIRFSRSFTSLPCKQLFKMRY